MFTFVFDCTMMAEDSITGTLINKMLSLLLVLLFSSIIVQAEQICHTHITDFQFNIESSYLQYQLHTFFVAQS